MSNTNNTGSTNNVTDTNIQDESYKSMTFIQYQNMKARLTHGCTISCEDCLLSRWKNGTRFECNELEEKFPEKAAKILYGWSMSKKIKTRKEYFLEVFPNAINKNGIPRICVKYVGYPVPQICDDCMVCWNEGHTAEDLIKE